MVATVRLAWRSRVATKCIFFKQLLRLQNFAHNAFHFRFPAFTSDSGGSQGTAPFGTPPGDCHVTGITTCHVAARWTASQTAGQATSIPDSKVIRQPARQSPIRPAQPVILGIRDPEMTSATSAPTPRNSRAQGARMTAVISNSLKLESNKPSSSTSLPIRATSSRSNSVRVLHTRY